VSAWSADESTLSLWEDFRDPYVRDRVLRCAEGLARRDFGVRAVPTISEANRQIVGKVDRRRNIYYWGPTLEELGMLETLHARGNAVRSSFPLVGGTARLGSRPRRLTESDVYMTSACAVTVDGILVEISPEGLDIFAPGSSPGMVVVVAGYNKIVDDLDEGLRRSRDICIPQCARLLDLGLPCEKSGRCIECDTPHPICSVLSVVTRKPRGPDILVVLVGEQLGY
jgi:hypothetical protein